MPGFLSRLVQRRPIAPGVAVGVALGLLVPCGLAAQVRPDLPWQTLTTVHFRVHFTPPLAELAIRTAANAERAWTELAAELPEPRGPIDIVLADNVDIANGSATPFPSNRIVIHARPPVSEMTLRNHRDWNRSVVTHELAHIFQLDRAAGWWDRFQALFGRAAPFFPHAYAPVWLVEGVAVHYETKLAGGGRLAGTEFPAYLRALSLDRALPPLDAVNLERPFFPGGQSAYLFGAFLVERGLRNDPTADDRVAVRRLFDGMSHRLLPWRHDRNSQEAFGATFSALYAEWSDSVRRASDDDAFPADDPAVTELVPAQWTARYPRFLPDGDLLYVADDERRSPALHRVSPDGRRVRVGRRNTVDANTPSDGSTVQGELEFADPYTLRSDLFRGQGLSRERLTSGERLSHPDVHPASGRIVAVQTIPGSTELVTLTQGLALPTRFTEGTLDLSWGEPRWSPDGRRVAAVIWERGGRTSVVIVDERGREVQRFSPRGAGLTVVSAPAWVPGDSMIVFVSDHEGRPMIYLGDVRTGAYGRIWGTRTALNTPDVSADGARIAAVELRADGYRVVVRAMPAPPPLERPVTDLESLSREAAPDPIVAIATPYRARRTVRPTWWLPAATSTSEGRANVGFLTAGADVVGRHQWIAQAQFEPRNIELSGAGAYTYARFGNPTLTLAAQSDWSHFGVFDMADNRVGTLAGQTTIFGASVLAMRRRIRHSAFLRVGYEFEIERYRTYPAGLIDDLSNDYFRQTHTYPQPFVSLGMSTMQRPGLSVSTEDGIAVNATYRARGRYAVDGSLAHEATAALTLAKSIPMPGYARHVVAVRAAAGALSGDARLALSVGGISGTAVEVLPGLTLGGDSRTFFVRGFEAGAQRGSRAGAASVEYRAPLFRVGRGYRFVPAFLQKTALIAFSDAAAAWCDTEVADTPSCEAPLRPRSIIASAGGELVLDGAVFGESLYRARFGFARPVRGYSFASSGGTFYFSLGNTF